MQLNNYLKRTVRLIVVTAVVASAVTAALFWLGNRLQQRSEAAAYAAYDLFCLENDLRFFQGLGFFPLSGSWEEASVGYDYLSRLVSDSKIITELEDRNIELKRQAELAAEITPPAGVRFLHQELTVRLRAAAVFGGVLASAVRADSIVYPGGSLSLDWPEADLTDLATEYFDSLYRILFLMDIIEADNLDQVPACASFGDYDRRLAGRYVARFRGAFNPSDETQTVPRTILVEPDRGE